MIGIRELGVETLSVGAPVDDSGAIVTDLDGAADAAVAPDVVEADACAALPNVAGHWTGGFVQVVAGYTYAFNGGSGNSVADLVQDCAVLTGSMSIDGCLDAGQVYGTLAEDDSFDGTISVGAISVTLKATKVNPHRIGGEFSIQSGVYNCVSQSGTFQLTR